MKLATATLSALLFCEATFGQKYPQTLVDSLCNLTIEYYYTDFMKPPDRVEAIPFKPRDPFILKSELTLTLKSQFKDFMVRFVTQQEALDEFAKTKNRTGSLEKLFVTQLQDTIDIDIGSWEVRVTKVKYKNGKVIPIHSSFTTSCGGTLGAIPICRFIYETATHSWTRYTWQETANAIRKANQRE